MATVKKKHIKFNRLKLEIPTTDPKKHEQSLIDIKINRSVTSPKSSNGSLDFN